MKNYLFINEDQETVLIRGARVQDAINTPTFSDFLAEGVDIGIEDILGYIEGSLSCIEMCSDSYSGLAARDVNISGLFSGVRFHFVE